MKGDNPIQEFTYLVKKNHLAGIDLASIVKPDGYAAQIARNSEIKRTQLRKIFAEFKRVFDGYRKSKSFGEEELTALYMLFPILEYQKNRNLLSEDFVRMMEAVIESMINNPSEENVKRAEQFLTALVAYARES
jgi:CRISPR type III-A-associated protein Csm2